MNAIKDCYHKTTYMCFCEVKKPLKINLKFINPKHQGKK